jgi:hypothetical protein
MTRAHDQEQLFNYNTCRTRWPAASLSQPGIDRVQTAKVAPS